MESGYPNLYARIVTNTAEPEDEQDCWLWLRHTDRWGYGRLNVYVPGLKKRVKMMAHIVAFLSVHSEPESVDELALQYQSFVHSGLEVDHLCVQPGCCNPNHHEAVTASENCKRRNRVHPDYAR